MHNYYLNKFIDLWNVQTVQCRGIPGTFWLCCSNSCTRHSDETTWHLRWKKTSWKPLEMPFLNFKMFLDASTLKSLSLSLSSLQASQYHRLKIVHMYSGVLTLELLSRNVTKISSYRAHKIMLVGWELKSWEVLLVLFSSCFWTK